MRDLSVIIPTCNRAQLLDRCLSTLSANLTCNYEIIVVDGASTDRTADVLDEAADLFGDRLTWIREDRRQGFVRAANKGFRVATGNYLTWLNDDARPVGAAYENAISQLESRSIQAGLVALYHRFKSVRNVAFEQICKGERYQLCHVRGTLYANFAVAHREIFEQLNYFDERYKFYGADPDFSLKAWHSRLTVEPAKASFIDHDEHLDDRRTADAEQGKADNVKLFAKWDLPPANQVRNEFDSKCPCTLGWSHKRQSPPSFRRSA